MYVAEIINLECHGEIKCGKFKVGFIVRHEMTSSHISRITHLTPYAHFDWYSLQNLSSEDNLRQIGKDWESLVAKQFDDQRIIKSREVY